MEVIDYFCNSLEELYVVFEELEDDDKRDNIIC